MTVDEGTGGERETLRAAVAERLGAVWGGAVALAPAEAGGGAVSGRGHVLRFSVARAPADSPATVVVKLPPPAPRFLCGSHERGFIVMEDLGTGARHHALLGADAAEATRPLVGLFAAVGRTHAITWGRRARFEGILEQSALFPAITETTRRTLEAFTTRWTDVPEMPPYAAFR